MKNSTLNQKDSAHPLLYKGCALAMAMSTAFTPAVSSAAALFPGLIGRTVVPFTPSVNQLPELRQLNGGATVSSTGNVMTVTQSKDKVIIDWSSFNIGSGASVNFKQPGSNSAALNRIYDLSPSVINGSLTANGKVYLINRNGVFFGPSGSVQVQSLIASSFDISDTDFNNGRLRFDNTDSSLNAFDTRTDDDPAVIQNEGAITAKSGGSVFLIGPKVKNLGRISAPAGKIDLVGLKANGKVEIKEILADRGVAYDVLYGNIDHAGDVANMAGGSLAGEDGGIVGLYGNTVRNDGLIRTVTTRKSNGVIILAAKDSVATGLKSRTDIDISDSTEAMGRVAQVMSPGRVYLTGLFQKAAVETNASLQGTLKRIDHEGSITAHSGNVDMEAVERVFLGSKSSIDVSGLKIERSMADQFIEAQLNSLYLRDDYGQKYNSFPAGSKVTVDVLKGSTIGNLSTYYLGMSKNAGDLSTAGGKINIGASDKPNAFTKKYDVLGDIIVSKGANFNISGGYTRYSGNGPATSKLVTADGHVYDISTAPQWLTYSGLFGQMTKSYGKYGSEVLKGISFGGHLIPLKALSSKLDDRIVGADAGTLGLRSRVVAGLSVGAITADLMVGRYQTATTAYTSTDNDKYIISLNRGLEEPKGGTLVVGNSLSKDLSSEASIKEDAGVSSIAVNKTVTAIEPGTQSWDGELLSPDTTTELSSDMINQAGLGALEMNANTTITTAQDARINLRPGGRYLARGRRIEFLGGVTTAGGTVEMLTRPNLTSFATMDNLVNPLYNGDIRETIYLGGASAISTAGEQVDYSLPAISAASIRTSAHTSGGSISLLNYSESGVSGAVLSQENEGSVVVSKGAALDVSGGYLINAKGAVSGGDAGTLTIKAPTISLDPDAVLRGFSLAGKKGGEVVLHAQEVAIASQGKQFLAGFGINDRIQSDLAGKLILGADRFQDSGFTRFNLSATNNLTVEAGVSLSPSLIKSAPPNRIAMAGATCNDATCTLLPSYATFSDLIGKTSYTLTAGKNVYDAGFYNSKLERIGNNESAELVMSAGSSLSTAAGGTVTLTGPTVHISGTISSPGGTVTVTAGSGDLTLHDGGRILAAGYNQNGIATAVGQPLPVPVPVPGGSVVLEANRTLNLEQGARVDVSGSEPFTGVVQNADGSRGGVAVSGDAGSLSLTYGTALMLDGNISGSGKLAGARGGDLKVKNKAGDLTLTAADVSRFQSNGFDGLTFASSSKIIVPVDLNLAVGRSLTLDSKLIEGTGSQGSTVTLSAPWVRLVNSGELTETAITSGAARDTSSGSISFQAKNLDLEGSVQLKGFSGVSLRAERDLTVKDRTYAGVWKGDLNTDAAALTLQASRIYPTTATKFNVTTPGKVSILPGVVNTAPVYSAGGNLTITAGGGIEHRGVLVAPLGSITLDGGSGRVDLSEASVISTAGSAPVAYGLYDGSTWWDKYVDSSNTGAEVTGAPAKSITLKGGEVVVRDGAIQDLSGGGSVYASYFQSGIPGTNNPLAVKGRYVILPDGSASYPGESVYLEACPELGLKAGVYSILPAEYAFVPGALVIQDTGAKLLAGQTAVSKEHYPVVGGYTTYRDTNVSSRVLKGFSVRRASDVLKEGDFTVKRFTGGDGGAFALNSGKGAYYGGTLRFDPLAGFGAGSLSFAAKNVEIVDNVATPDYNLTLGDTLRLDGDALSQLPVGKLKLGDSDTTSSVTVQNNVAIKARAVALAAKDRVELKDGAQVEATGTVSGDYVSVETATGAFSMGKEAGFTSKKGIVLEVNSYTLDDSATLNSGASGYFSLSADRISFDDASKTFWEKTFANNGNLEIAGRSGMFLAFQEADVTLKNSGTLTLDAPRYSYTGTKNVTFESGTIELRNSSASTGGTATPPSGGEMTLRADTITVAPRLDGTKGNIAFEGIKTVNLDSKNDLVFKGEGTVSTQGGLNLYAARITTDADSYKSDSDYTVANITLDGRSGAVTLNGSTRNGTAGTTSTPGGSLTILGDSIAQTGGVLDTAAGQINLTAVNDISVSGAILAKGMGVATAKPNETAYYSGGTITLQSDKGRVDLKSGSILDVSAAAQGDAGSIVLSATSTGKGVSIKKDVTDANGVVTKGARLAGAAGSGGKGGSFSIDSASLDGVGGLDGLSSTLVTRTLLDKSLTGGFNNQISIRSRSGDLVLSSDSTTLTGREVVIAADNGAITISGKTVLDKDGNQVVTGGINADTSDGSGRIELYAGKKLNLESGATLTARGKDAGAHGGTVLLSSQDGSGNTKTFGSDYALNVKDGSTIDVSGNGGAGGTVAFRAYKNASNDDVNMAAVGGDAIKGASSVSVEAVQAYTANAGTTTVGNVTYNTVGELGGYTKYLTDAGTTKDRLFKTITDTSAYHLKEGIEISSSGNLLVDKELDLKSVNPGGEAVVLTLKSGKELLINQKITDARTSIDTLHSYKAGAARTMEDTAAINLIAGSDGGANFRGVNKGSALTSGAGNLVIAANKVVYSENAPIHVAAGNNLTLNGWSATAGPSYMINGDMKYNLGSYGGAIRGDVGNDFNLKSAGSAIQTALGGISITTGHDLNLGSAVNAGAIRTTGEYDNSSLTAKMPGMALDTVTNRTSYWTYHKGGDIALAVGNSVSGNLETANGWDGVYTDKDASATQKTQFPWYLTAGFGGGSENKIPAVPVTVGIAAMAGGNVSVKAGGSLKTQIGAFGAGNLNVSSGREMNGRFRVMNGSGALTSAGGLGTAANPVVFELAAAKVKVAAMGDVRIGTVQNPDNTRDKIFPSSSTNKWNLTYTQDSSFRADSLRGNAVIYGANPYASYSMASSTSVSSLVSRKYILPASFALSAGKDITVRGQYILAPSTNGNLNLSAAGDIRGDYVGGLASGFTMQDLYIQGDADKGIAGIYGRQVDSGSILYNMLTGDIHYGVNHLADTEPVVVTAGNDIDTLTLKLNKAARVTAKKGDINNLFFTGQNTTPESVTSIIAGGSIDQGISLESSALSSRPVITLGGPGTLLVQAGDSINLGNSGGISSVGNQYNSSFSGDGARTDADLIVVAGAKESASMAKKDVSAFFAAIATASDEISSLRNDGKTVEADQLLAETGKSISAYFKTYDDANSGTGNLALVDSAISTRSGALYVMAAGNMDIGKTALSSAPKDSSGITTLYGGALNVFAGNDINVNESRLMTFMGGDITIWSDQGDINAGRGSKTVVSAPKANYTFDDYGVLTSIRYTPPAAGSGIRALTFDPDGEKGPIDPPEAGDIHIYAKGALDAGEAGIQGKKVLVAANVVLNAINIGSTIASVGVPSASQNTVSIGPMTGASDITSDKKMIESISNSIAATEKKTALAESEDYVMKYLDVKIIDLSNEPI